MYENANEAMVQAISARILAGEMSPEEAAKLMNTLARFEERTSVPEIHGSVEPGSK